MSNYVVRLLTILHVLGHKLAFIVDVSFICSFCASHTCNKIFLQ